MDIVCYAYPSPVVGLQLGSEFAERFKDEIPIWTLKQSPTNLKVGDRIYFACEEKIRGYFLILTLCKGIRKIKKEKIKGTHIGLGKWKDIEPIKIKNFRDETGGSWRYFNKICKKLSEGKKDY